MTTNDRNLSNSYIYERLSTVRMSVGERNDAAAALASGDKIADVILGTARVLRLLVAIPALKPTFKPLKPSFRH